MEYVYRLENHEYEWDTRKAHSNLDKHGVDFAEAAEVFFDEYGRYGDASVGTEAREFLIGYSFSNRLLLIVHMERGDRTRIISARPATRYERKTLYEED